MLRDDPDLAYLRPDYLNLLGSKVVLCASTCWAVRLGGLVSVAPRSSGDLHTIRSSEQSPPFLGKGSLMECSAFGT